MTDTARMAAAVSAMFAAVEGSLGLVIATLVTGSSRASERDRALGSYRAGLIAGRDRR